jgi:hypothetical protein
MGPRTQSRKSFCTQMLPCVTILTSITSVIFNWLWYVVLLSVRFISIISVILILAAFMYVLFFVQTPGDSNADEKDALEHAQRAAFTIGPDSNVCDTDISFYISHVCGVFPLKIQSHPISLSLSLLHSLTYKHTHTHACARTHAHIQTHTTTNIPNTSNNKKMKTKKNTVERHCESLGSQPRRGAALGVASRARRQRRRHDAPG